MLAELRYAVLAINTGDGAPSQSVMWFDLDPDEHDVILMNTKVERLKYRQLRRDPRVSVLFENGLDWTSMRGTATLDATFQPALDHIQALARRYGSDPSRFEGQERLIIRSEDRQGRSARLRLSGRQLRTHPPSGRTRGRR